MQTRADNTSVDQQPSGRQEEPFHSSLAELGASYIATDFIAVPALGHPVHLTFPSADIPHTWCAIPVPRSSLASESIPMMLPQHIQNVQNGQTVPTVREIELQGSVALCQTLKGTHRCFGRWMRMVSVLFWMFGPMWIGSH